MRRSSTGLTLSATALLAIAVTACGEIRSTLDQLTGAANAPPDSLPRLLTDSLPFKYPIALYLQLIDDSVTLRLHIDAYGRPVPESTQVAVPARYAEFDTSAVQGARELLFRPAFRDGRAVPYTVLFPIQFRVPEQPVTSDSGGD
jgi:protein TonB